MCLRRCVGQAPPFLALKPCTSFRNAVHPPMSNCLLTFGGEGPKVSKNPPLFPPLRKSKNGFAPHANQPRAVFLSNRPLRKKVGARARQGGRILCLTPVKKRSARGRVGGGRVLCLRGGEGRGREGRGGEGRAGGEGREDKDAESLLCFPGRRWQTL